MLKGLVPVGRPPQCKTSKSDVHFFKRSFVFCKLSIFTASFCAHFCVCFTAAGDLSFSSTSFLTNLLISLCVVGSI